MHNAQLQFRISLRMCCKSESLRLGCEKTPTIMFGTATLDDPNNSTVGATAKVTCEFGYNTTKTSIICSSTGAWENADCVAKGIGQPR